MVTFILLLFNICLYLLRRFILKKRCHQRILSSFCILSLIVWTVYHGGDDFIQFRGIWIITTILAIYPIYLLSLFIVGTKFTKENLLPFSCIKETSKFKKALTKESLHNVYSSTYEELLYRWFFQNALLELTHSIWISIILGSLVFFAVHIRKRIAIVQLIDIFTFSLIITVWFHFSKNPFYCILIHIARNQLIIFQKYVSIRKELQKKQRYYQLLKEKRGLPNEHH